MVEVELIGEDVRDVDGETYADLLAPFDVSRHEVSVVVDGRPVPTDARVDPEADRVRVVKLVRGG
ncbi:MAG: ubiquitin-like small modifier protein 2 [Salinirussus sp.]